MTLKNKLKKYNIKPNPLKDQFFLINNKKLDQIVKLANLKDKDMVLEVGSGPANLTKKLAHKAGKVIAVEIDQRFKPFYKDLPDNIEIIWQDADKILDQGDKTYKKKKFNKLISNLPYSIIEWLMHNITFVKYDKIIITIPKKFYYSIKKSGIFTSFFKPEKKLQVNKTDFYPQPKTNSVVIDLKRIPNPIKTKDLGLFLRRFVYQHEDWKVKNSLREGLIKYVKEIYNKQLTKNQARTIIKKSEIKNKLLDHTPNNDQIYFQISQQFDNSIFTKLIKNNQLIKL